MKLSKDERKAIASVITKRVYDAHREKIKAIEDAFVPNEEYRTLEDFKSEVNALSDKCCKLGIQNYPFSNIIRFINERQATIKNNEVKLPPYPVVSNDEVESELIIASMDDTATVESLIASITAKYL